MKKYVLAGILILPVLGFAATTIIKNQDGTIAEQTTVDPDARKIELKASIEESQSRIGILEKRIVELQADIVAKQALLTALTEITAVPVDVPVEP